MWWRTRLTTRSTVERGERQAAEQLARELGPDRIVTQEAAVGERRRLADVVDQRREPDDRPVPWRRVDGPDRVIPEILAADLGLGDPALGRELGRDPLEESGRLERPQSDRRARGVEQLLQLDGDPLAGQVADELGVGLDRGQRRRLDAEPERRREPDRPDHPKRVLAEPGVGIARRPGGAAGRRSRDPVMRVEQPGHGTRWTAPGHGVDVKSRRARSTSIDSPNSTRWGRRKSA